MPNPDASPKAELVSVANITMELMQKYVKDDGAVGVDNLERWPSDSTAVGFLSTTTSADSINELRKVSGPSLVDVF